MPEVTVDFKFNVGDFVTLKQDVRAYNLMTETDRKYSKPAQQFMIVERLFNQCYNTTQNHYNVRGYDIQTGRPNLLSFVEVELEAVPNAI